jgi:hypothetical protein
MLKSEAIQEMQNGRRITHEYFDNNEFMTMKDGQICLEDGVKCSPEEYWKWRTTEDWETGYSFYD